MILCSVLISAAAAARADQLFLVSARAAEVLTRGCFLNVRGSFPRYERGEHRTFGGRQRRVLKGKTKCSVLISAAAAVRADQLFLVLARAAGVLTRGCFPNVRGSFPRYERGERRTFGGRQGRGDS
ncbi:hypothetical protein NDU88_007431 [Pleurodeles waltl]|uniref:Secreted protein n=1 Tax=Pleurodeles waltl TaxID=8319 RepID=A0AAV7NW93_PLEWA|nr:hypothetical protein NDU88_007431 [Pleurodeles waltl]